jgi:hypothetical protein
MAQPFAIPIHAMSRSNVAEAPEFASRGPVTI